VTCSKCAVSGICLTRFPVVHHVTLWERKRTLLSRLQRFKCLEPVLSELFIGSSLRRKRGAEALVMLSILSDGGLAAKEKACIADEGALPLLSSCAFLGQLHRP